MLCKGIPVACGVQLPILPLEVSLLAYLLGLTFLTSLRGLDMAVTRGVDGGLCAASRAAHACVRACGWVWMGVDGVCAQR